MIICPHCGVSITNEQIEDLDYIECEVPGCHEEAVYDGWHKGETLNRRIRVCEEHKTLLIGFQTAAKEGKEPVFTDD